MTDELTGTLVLKDTAGHYFLLSRGELERRRVPEERTAEIEQVIATAATHGDAGGDVVGYGDPPDTSVARMNMSYTFVAFYLPRLPVHLP